MEVNVMKNAKDACEAPGKTNIFIACFTSALARLKLYAELEKLGEKVLYYDTDSLIYRWKEGEPFILTGIFFRRDDRRSQWGSYYGVWIRRTKILLLSNVRQ